MQDVRVVGSPPAVKFRAGQVAQVGALLPLNSLSLPQLVQPEASPGAYVPATQLVQPEAPPGAYVPATQLWHAVGSGPPSPTGRVSRYNTRICASVSTPSNSIDRAT